MPDETREEMCSTDANVLPAGHSALRTAWALTRPYFVSQEAWSARGLVLAVVALNVGEIGLQVMLSDWNRRFFNAAQDLDRTAFMHEALLFPAFVAPLICAYSLEAFLSDTLRMRWRAWLCKQCIDLWLRDQAYYRLRWTEGGTDNPDQRISEDVTTFVDKTLGISVSFLYSVLGLFSFVAILWRLSGSADLHLPVFGSIHIPGYLVWGAVVYAIVGTALIHRVGKPLVRIGYRQQQREADFRFALVRLRENAESVALYAGEQAERHILRGRFQALMDNTRIQIRRNVALSFASSAYNNGATIVPWILASARYFAGAVKFGDLTQATSAFGQVRYFLSVIVDRYGDLATWRATVDRLAGFAAAVQAVRPVDAARRPSASVGPGAPSSRLQLRASLIAGGSERTTMNQGLATINCLQGEASALTVSEVATHTPDGEPIAAPMSLVVSPGERVLLSGPSGAGKTTLLRAIAGLWPFGSGTIVLPSVKTLMLSQRPYLPLGSLRDAVCFPRRAPDVASSEVTGALIRVGLGHLVPEMEREADWSQILSLGEQQRVAFARAIIVQPGMLVLDEATSALDSAAEHDMYTLARAELPNAIVLSVGHRDSLAAHHDRRVVLSVANGVGATGARSVFHGYVRTAYPDAHAPL